MADSKPVAEPQPQPEPKKPKVTRGIINQNLLDALDKAGVVLTAARKADHAASLAAREISAECLNQFEADIAVCKARVGKANELTNQVRLATQTESEARDDLLAALREIQAAAKQKYARSAPLQMKDYFVSERLDPSRAALVQVADSISEKLKADTLPGITPAKVAGLKTLRDAYVGANAAQADAQSKSSTEREAIEAAVGSITDRRVQIQFAAEAEWPASNKANAPIRREFQLPPDRPLRG
jgi:hypothetical protein